MLFVLMGIFLNKKFSKCFSNQQYYYSLHDIATIYLILILQFIIYLKNLFFFHELESMSKLLVFFFWFFFFVVVVVVAVAAVIFMPFFSFLRIFLKQSPYHDQDVGKHKLSAVKYLQGSIFYTL